MKIKLILNTAIALLILSACNSGKVPKDAKIVEYGTKGSEISEEDGMFTASNFSLNIPANWKEEAPSSNLRVTQFRPKDSPEYEVVVSYFGNTDNMVEANIERWKDQFTNIDQFQELALNVTGVTAVKITGTYQLKPFPMADNFVDTPDYGTLAAIVSSVDGPYFLRINAPVAVIEQQEKAFTDVLNTYKTK